LKTFPGFAMMAEYVGEHCRVDKEPVVVKFSTKHPKLIVSIMVLATVAMALPAALPSLWPRAFGFLNSLKVDTDPENMLSKDEAVRIYNNRMKKALSINDMVVLGVVNEKDQDGVFNPASLKRIYELTEYAKTLQWPVEGERRGESAVEAPDPGTPQGLATGTEALQEAADRAGLEGGAYDYEGVIAVDIIAPSTVDNIEQGGLGTVRFEWLMRRPPATREEALAIRDKARRIPFLQGTLVSENGKALCLYLPLTSKDMSYKVYSRLRDKIATFSGDERYFITGLPVAQDTFGVEMFVQMAISAPLAMVVIFLLLLLFFRKLVLVLSPMILALVSVIITMGLLVVTGHTIHIMSSMIPIFIMPIAVLDSVHILSEFFDRYRKTKDRRKTILEVMDALFLPMLCTSLTTTAGFGSMALTPIPPVQVFGVFVAVGVMLAWLLTIVFIPAFIMLIPKESLQNFGARQHGEGGTSSLLARFLQWVGGITYRRAYLILLGAGLVVVVAVYGITRIRVNDNPTRWFTKSHPIRVADSVLNRHFAGTYMAYLVFEAPDTEVTPQELARTLVREMSAYAEKVQGNFPDAPVVFTELEREATDRAEAAASTAALLDQLEAFATGKVDETDDFDLADAWDEASAFIDSRRRCGEIFKDPEVLRYIADLQKHLQGLDVVGKSNSLADIVKTVHRELFLGKDDEFRVPETPQMVAECLITYQGSHRPQDMWHFVTPDYRITNIWVQLKSGDNKDMSRVVEAVEEYTAANPPPGDLSPAKWFGLTYINVVWQKKMVIGMLQAFLGSFLVVFLMMVIFFRSALWGLISMIPLAVTIGLIYGVIGLIGKDYDMPVAILSSMTLGLAVDFAIHFLSRTRAEHARFGSWEKTAGPVFGEPARAITRNIIVIAVGFLPLVAAPLVPYKTVGVFLAAILSISGVATLLIVPALIRLFEKFMFPKTKVCRVTCKCITCIVSAAALIAVAAINIHQFMHMGWTRITWLSLVVLVVLAAACAVISRREKCRERISAEVRQEEETI